MKQRRTNPANEGSSQSLAVDPPTLAETVLVVDLWSSPPVNDQADDMGEFAVPLPQAVVPLAAFAMVGDLLSVDGGQLREPAQDSVSASFRETVYAVNAARHLQRLVRGFSRASTTGPLHASFTLIAASEADVSDFAPTHTYSGQILCAGSLCDTIRTIPGLQFTNLPSGTASHGALIQLLPPVHMEGYVNEALEPRPPVVSSQPAPAVESPRMQAAMESAGASSASRPAAPASSSVEGIPVKIFSPRLVVGSVAGVAVVGTILIFSPLLRHSAPQPGQAVPADSDRPVVPQPVPNAASSNPTAPAPLAKASEATPQKQKDQTHPKPLPSPPATPQADLEAPRPGRQGMNFSSSEIEDLILRADKDSGNGAYDRAILEYRTVLNNDPSNELAKKGLAKALYNKSHQ